MFGIIKKFTIPDGYTEEDVELLEMCPTVLAKSPSKIDIDADLSNPDVLADIEPLLTEEDVAFLNSSEALLITAILKKHNIRGSYTLGYLMKELYDDLSACLSGVYIPFPRLIVYLIKTQEHVFNNPFFEVWFDCPTYISGDGSTMPLWTSGTTVRIM